MTSFSYTRYTVCWLFQPGFCKNKFLSWCGFLTTDLEFFRVISLTSITLESLQMDVRYLWRITKLVIDKQYFPFGYLLTVQERERERDQIKFYLLRCWQLFCRVKTRDPSLSTAASSTLLVTLTDSRPKHNLTCNDKEEFQIFH